MIQIGEGVFKSTASTYEKMVKYFVRHCKKKWKIDGACEDNLVDWLGDENEDYFKRMYFKCDGCQYTIRMFDSTIHHHRIIYSGQEPIPRGITIIYGIFRRGSNPFC